MAAFLADSLCCSPVKWKITSGVINIIFNAWVKAENPQIKSVQHRNHGVRQIHSIQVFKKGSTRLKEFFVPKIFVRLPLGINNLMHFHGREHDLRTVKNIPLPTLTPAVKTKCTFNSCDSAGPHGLSSVSWQRYHPVTLCKNWIRKYITTSCHPSDSVRFSNILPSCHWSLVPGTPHSCTVLDWSPINFAPINHSSPMFVCRSLWYD